MVTTERRSF